MNTIKIPKSICQRKFTAREFIESKISEIKEKNSQYNFLVSLFEDYALQKASEIDNNINRNKKPGKLADIPLGIKDNIVMKHGKTTCCSKILAKFKFPYNATVIDKIEQEDGIIIGKTNMDEFAMGSSTEYSAFNKTKNPYKEAYVP